MEKLVEQKETQKICISCNRIAERCNPRSCKNPQFKDQEIVRMVSKLEELSKEELEVIVEEDLSSKKAKTEEKLRKRAEKFKRNSELMRRMTQSEEDEDEEKDKEKRDKEKNQQVRVNLANDNVNKIALFKAKLAQDNDMSRLDRKKALREFKNNLKEDTDKIFEEQLTKSEPIESPKKCASCGKMYASKEKHECEK